MTTEDLQLFAKEIGATVTNNPTTIKLRTKDCTVSVGVYLGLPMTRRKVARMLVDKIEAVFSPSEDLLIPKERLEQVQ
jgi:hypothetical protein